MTTIDQLGSGYCRYEDATLWMGKRLDKHCGDGFDSSGFHYRTGYGEYGTGCGGGNSCGGGRGEGDGYEVDTGIGRQVGYALLICDDPLWLICREGK